MSGKLVAEWEYIGITYDIFLERGDYIAKPKIGQHWAGNKWKHRVACVEDWKAHKPPAAMTPTGRIPRGPNFQELPRGPEAQAILDAIRKQ